MIKTGSKNIAIKKKHLNKTMLQQEALQNQIRKKRISRRLVSTLLFTLPCECSNREKRRVRKTESKLLKSHYKEEKCKKETTRKPGFGCFRG